MPKSGLLTPGTEGSIHGGPEVDEIVVFSMPSHGQRQAHSGSFYLFKTVLSTICTLRESSHFVFPLHISGTKWTHLSFFFFFILKKPFISAAYNTEQFLSRTLGE